MREDIAISGERTEAGGRLDDAGLLHRYAEDRAEDAFTALVERHISLVYSAALRQLGGGVHRAEEVTQTVFLHLARQAAALSRRDDIVGWLYTTTHYTAAKLKRTEARRQLYEQEAQIMHELLAETSAQAEWEQLRPVLDEAMHELTGPDRQAILLRFFKNERFADVGRKLGLSEDGARMRVDRALDKLHALLAKRGITSTSAALAAALANQVVATVPAGLSASVAGAALSGAAVAGAGTLAAVFAFMSASKVSLSIAAAGAFVIATAVYQTNQARAATATLAEARRSHAAAAARFAELERNVSAAEQERAQREAALERRRAETATAAAKPASAAPVDDPNAKYQDMVNRLTQNDTELPKVWAVYKRFQNLEAYRPLFSQLGFTPAQMEQALDILVKPTAQARYDWGTKADMNPLAQARDEFRAAFGEAAGNRLGEFTSTAAWDARDFVNELSAKLYYTDAPFTPQQTERLIRTLKDTSTEPRFPQRSSETSTSIFRRTRDWDQIQAQAASFLAPEQLRGLQTLVAARRNSELMAAVVNESAAPKP